MKIKIQQNLRIANPETRDFLADAYYPVTAEQLPLIIFAHGYKGYKDWGAWHLMAETIAHAGFFFVKFNFSHNGTTLGLPAGFADLEAFGHNNFSKEMSDYDAVLNGFYSNPRIDQDRIAVIGHSRGGGISLLKAFEDERIKALVSLAGVSNFNYRFPSGDRLEKWRNSGVMFSENGRTKQQMPHYFQFYEDYKDHENRFNIQYGAQHLEKPFLIIQGTEDQAVKDKEAFLLKQWAKNSELFIMPGADHTFGAREPWTEKEMPPDLKTAAEKIVDFLQKKL